MKITKIEVDGVPMEVTADSIKVILEDGYKQRHINVTHEGVIVDEIDEEGNVEETSWDLHNGHSESIEIAEDSSVRLLVNVADLNEDETFGCFVRALDWRSDDDGCASIGDISFEMNCAMSVVIDLAQKAYDEGYIEII